MCGIAGICNILSNELITEQKLSAMISMLYHRGPDGKGFYIGQNIGLGHARLSIIDLDTGSQPIHNEDKTVWVTFNGEIFNYIELRDELKKKGHDFYTSTDTEVIVHLYEEYGDDFVTYLNGQFAIGLWDTKRSKLILVRDRVGIVPLFYKQENGSLLFASEIKAILAVAKESPKLDPCSLDELMTFWAPVSPNTMFQDVYELSPGQMLVLKNGQINKRRYWDWEFPLTNDEYNLENIDSLAEGLHELLVDATKIRLRSDVPVGAYLSGGLDSSVLTSLIHHYGNTPLRTFSIGFENQKLDESLYQKEMIDYLNADHSRITCSDSDIADNFEKTIWHTEMPVLRTAPVPMSMLSGLVHSQNYKVVLTGEGADEVLGGYDIFKEAKIRQFWARNPQSKFRPLLLKRLYPYLDLSKGQAYLQNFFGTAIQSPELLWFSHLPRWETTARCKDFFSDEMKAKLNKNDAISRIAQTFPSSMSKWHTFNRSQYIEAKSLMGGYLLSSQGDRALMSNSVEGRFPFLDHRVIEFANRIHPKHKMKVLNEKFLLKKAESQYVPENIINRYKQPYRAPDIPSFFGNNTSPEYVNALLSKSKISEYGYFEPDRVDRLVRKIKRGMAIGYKDNMSLVGILSTQIWHHTFIENNYENFGK
ncbi:MAG: asparagine synthase (glutamine-hydrolyzing) [Gammaproteobacteria bacterium]|nr:asparagine synthase (glutamine-hydrolyzing) [Gammaproteobacteria bacterium]MCW8909303.1 asparagine synthase (glutamine-hydrolyzing) [Gammaproteobacteria bacterium]